MVDQRGITFLWEGLDRNGGRARGEIVARSEISARAELRRQGIRVVRIRKKPKTWFRSSTKISTKEIAVFSRQLATMLAAGVPLVQAFDIVGSSHDNPAMQALLLEIRSDVAAGSPLADALAKHPVQFDELFCNLVRAGEQAGALETLLRKIADYKEKSESLRGKIRKALTYPTAIVAVAVTVTAILLVFVVPTFEELFKSFGADLPVFTRWVIRLSHGVQDWWFVVIGVLNLAGFGFVKLRQRSPAFRHRVDRWVLALPVIGLILHKSAVARFARTLATMSAAGVPLVEAMQSVAGATGNSLYAAAVLQMRDEVATGQQLQAAMRQVKLFPSMVVQMVAIGEESGVLDTMLGKVADFYEEEVDNAVDSLSSLLEPMIMVVLGVLVGGLVVAMYLPIFRLGSVI